ncbi:hypothetical protein HOT29_gp066 [Microbacterium phage Squash]|uniref:Uncharacterized protein n=1 Tax=Microbacterium phage Squash TaxID=2182357 RepID=A0A2U8UM08_9CAUD|nr:hypothetical protein HOT29_gp066 [Microbacterium phage Squash]AWN04685.1 hypothetical protein PBI_SQUASH_66 [Microbacterium phage Squash]
MTISRRTIADLVALPVETVDVLLEAGWTLQLSNQAPARFEQPLSADEPRIMPAIEVPMIEERDSREVAREVLDSVGARLAPKRGRQR